jgi:hypothetical protein
MATVSGSTATLGTSGPVSGICSAGGITGGTETLGGSTTFAITVNYHVSIQPPSNEVFTGTCTKM